MFSRRNFLQLGGIAVTGGLVLGPGINVLAQTEDKNPYFPVPATVYSDNVMSLNRQVFEPLLNSTFSFVKKDNDDETSLFEKRGSTSTLRLVEIVGDEQTKKYLSRKPVDSFSLIFESTRKSRLHDNIYTVSHTQLGQFSIFISTVGRSENRYQAVFSRIYS